MTKGSAFLSTVLAVALTGFSAASQATPPSWAPAHGYRTPEVREVREYRYVYYPEQRVYYAPATQSWFWMNGGGWQVGFNLPQQYQLSGNIAGIPVMLQSNRPYVQHVYVEENYGRPWREAHYRKVRHKHRRHDDHDRHHDHKHRHRDHWHY